MTLPHGALEQLLSPDGGVEAFDKAVADSKAQTQALLNREPAPGPTVAKNAYNQAKKDGKPDAATRDTVKSNEPAKEKGTVPPPGTFNTADMSDQDVIALAGIHVENVPSQLEPDSGALAALGEYVLNEGISSRVTNDLVNWWTDVVVETIGRDDVDYILETFPIVERKDEQAHGAYRTKRMILDICDAMQQAIETSTPYHTQLDPPPANA